MFLKKYLINGYVLHEKRLAEQSINELQQSMVLLQKTLTNNDMVSEVGAEAIEKKDIQLVDSYVIPAHKDVIPAHKDVIPA